MKVCVVGAGAIGGYLGAKLALAGHAQVSVLARGATLQALSGRGWQLQEQDGVRQVAVRASAQAEHIGPQDLVLIAVKGPALAGVALGLAPLLGPRTVVMTAMNGVPWWFLHGHSPDGSEALHSVDPEGQVARSIALERVLACVVHVSACAPQPGVVEHRMGRELSIGPVLGVREGEARAVVELFQQAGLDARLAADIRQDIWYKLWGNLTLNPVSALTGATAAEVLADPLVRSFCSAAMSEAARIGERIGCPVAQQPEDRHAITARLGAFKSSMLQDVEAGRLIELDSIVGVVRELGQRVGVATPAIDALLGLTRLFARQRGLYPQP